MNLASLQSQSRFLCNTDVDSYPSADLNANLTRWAHLFTTEIKNSIDDWDFQGEISTADLIADQREYVFPLDILKIKRIDLRLDGNNWRRANWIDESEIGTAIASEEDIVSRFNNSQPFVSLYDKSLFIFSGKITAVVNGIKIWYLKEVIGKNAAGDDITSFSVDTDTPNINEAFQRGLCYGAAKDWFQKYGLPQARDMDIELEKIIARMINFYSRRGMDRKVRLSTFSDIRNYE